MPTPPIAITGQSLDELKSQMLILFDELFQERVGGSLIGDVFSQDADDVLTLNLDTTPGIQKTSTGLKVIVKSTGGLTLDSSGVSIKIKNAADLGTDVDGLYLVGLSKFAFVTIACPAGTNPVADAAADQLNLAVGSTKITITGNAATDTITFDVAEGNIDHDALANFVAAEHINWSATPDSTNMVFGIVTGTKIGTGANQKIGFWNAAPIVQPTTAVAEGAFVENAGGTAVNVDSTFDGYTLQQIVKALRNTGILA